MKQTQTIPHTTSVPVAEPIARALPRALSERITITVILLIALAQGLLYMTLAPPWQHYDEPTHFEYAWLAAHGPHLLPQPGDENPAMRREVAASMLEQRFFQLSPDVPKPDLSSDGETWIGVSELGHPPSYYLLVSLPLRLFGHLDITSQLYLARCVSLLLLLVTVAASIGLLRDLTPVSHPLRWAVPLAITLLPPFVDLMTSVNNDVGAVAVFSLFLWAAARTIRYGLSWRRVVWLFGTALLAIATKNTAAIALPLAPLVVLLALLVQSGWRWRWLLVAGGVAAAVMLVAVLGWGDPADWYRSANIQSQNAAMRVENAAAPFGPHALMLEASTEIGGGQALNPLLAQDVSQLAGHTITVGGWLWTDNPSTSAALGIDYQTPDMQMAVPVNHGIALTTTPTFVAWTFVVPERTYLLNYNLYAAAPSAGAPLHVFLDGALVVDGEFPTAVAPVFADTAAHSGVWAGRNFTNLVRNASAEQSGPRLRPWFERMLGQYIHRSPSQIVAALLDPQRLAPVIVPYMVRPAVDGMVQAFAWSNVRLTDPIWLTLAGYLTLFALLGALKWLFRPQPQPQLALRSALLFLALVAALVWANTIFRPLPLLGGIYVVPAARYTFPAISVTMLAIVGGWWALWPHKLRLYAMLSLIGLLFVLDCVAISTIAAFYRALPLG